MNKFKGKALSLVLSLALVISSFSAVPASASTKTLNGSLGGDYDTGFYLVNGGEKANLIYEHFGTAVSNNPSMTTPDHEDVSDVHIAAISHKSGDRLVKWYDTGDGKEDSIDSDTEDGNIDLELRSSTVSGEEVLNILYKGTYTDDDDKEYTVKATKEVTVRVYDKNETVIGEIGDAGNHDADNGKKGELDSDFAQKTAAFELDKIANDNKASDADASLTDSKSLVVLRAVPSTDPLIVAWEPLKTVAYSSDTKQDDLTNEGAYYQLKVTGNNVELEDGATANAPTLTPGTSDESSPTYEYKNGRIVVTAPAGVLNKYTFKYSVKGGETETDVSDDSITGLDDGAEVTVTAYDAAGKAVEDSAVTFTYTKGVSDNIGTPTQSDASKAPTATLQSDGSVKVTAGTVDKKITYKVADSEDEKDITSDLSVPADVVSAGKEVTISAYNEGSTEADATTKFTFTSGHDASIGDAKGNDSVALTLGEDGSVTVANTAAKDVTLTYTVKSGDATTAAAAVPEAGIPIAKLKSADVVTLTANQSGKSIGANSFTYTTNKPTAQDYVTAQVSTKANTGKLTFTAVPTDFAEAQNTAKTTELYSTKDIKAKDSITKTIKVTAADGITDFSKYSTSTYLYSGSVDKNTYKYAVKVNGYEVNFDDATANVKVDDKASVTEISGTVKSVTVSEGSVGSLDIDNDGSGAVPSVTISDAKVGDIDFDSDGGTVDVNSTGASVGNITDATTVTIENGTVGNVDADEEVSVRAEDEDHTVSVGDITSKKITVDSDNSKASVGTLKASDENSEITLTGDFVTVKAIDFDNYNAELKIDDFVGSIPAPKNATKDGATVSTNATDDKVTIKGDADINTVVVGDDSSMIFDSKLEVGSIDGSGTLVVGLGKMNITSSASGVVLKFSDPTLTAGATAFTAVTDTVDEDSMDGFGFTLSKTEGSKTDTFKIASTKLVGLTFAKTSSEIAKGYSETFTASAYAPGTTIPAGYKVQYTLDGDDDVFDLTSNNDGSVTVKVVDYDKDFAEENKATLKAELVDADGDVDDDYVAGDVDLTAIATPKVAFTSDTAVKAMKVGDSYRFRITSADGTQPKNFVVASNAATVTYRGNSGKDYFYDVKAVKEGSYGVYVAGTKLAVLNITNAFSIDTKTVSVNAGASYQFKVTGPSQPRFQVAGVGDIKLTSKSGNNYFFKVTVPSNLAKGGHGVYVNGVAMAVVTVK